MLKPRNISFFRIMTAGYISEETYRAIYPRKMFYELSLENCDSYDQNISAELRRLFEDSVVITNLFLLEKIEEVVELKNTRLLDIFVRCLRNENSLEINSLILKIGENIFLKKYAFISEASLKNMYYVTPGNLGKIINFRRLVLDCYIKFFSNPNSKEFINPCIDVDVIDGCCNVESPTLEKESNSIQSCEENPKTIEYQYSEVECSVTSEGKYLHLNDDLCGKYVLFLKSLDEEQIKPFKEFLEKKMLTCSTRFVNVVNEIGCRRFYEEFLFADPLEFFKLERVGKKTVYDFKQIKQSVIDFVVSKYNASVDNYDDEELRKEESQKDFIKKNNDDVIRKTQHAMLQKKLQSLLSLASVRAQNTVRAYSGNGDFIEDFVLKGKDLLYIKGVGLKTKNELNIIVNKLKLFVEFMPQKEISKEELFLADKENKYGDFIDKFSQNFYIENGHLPMTHIFESFIKQFVSYNKFFSTFNKIQPFFVGEQGEEISKIAKLKGYTSENVRHHYRETIKKINSIEIQDNKCFINGEFFACLEDWEYINSYLSTQNLFKATDLLEFFSDEKSNLNIEFLCVVLAQLYPEKFSILGQSSFLPTKKSNWNNLYIIKKEILDVFDFDKIFTLLDDFIQNQTFTITKSVSELLMDLFLPAWKDYNPSMFNEIEQIVTKFLIVERELFADFDNNFTIVGKKEENPNDIVYEMLKETNEPLSTDVIFEKIQEKFSNKYKSKDSFACRLREDIRFCALGVDRKISLTEWTHVKIGSIRDLIVDYLSKYDEPKHISDIVEFVLKHRDTSEKNIRASMHSGEQFKSFEDGFWGLSDKSYSDFFIQSESVRNHLVKIGQLEDFLREHKRFPIPSSQDKKECLLYVWWNRVNRKYDILEGDVKLEVERIHKVYGHLPKTKTDITWFSNCEACKDYILKYHCKPSNRTDEERNLLNWFNKAKEDFFEGDLSREKENAFIELTKLL